MFSFETTATTGVMEVLTSNNRGHSPDELTDLCLRKIISVADTAPAPIRDQAMAFREAIRPIIKMYMEKACRSDRTTLYHRLKDAGQHEAAEIIIKL